MVKVTKDGITRFVSDRDLQRFSDLGFKRANEKHHKPEPMVIQDNDKTDPKDTQKTTKKTD